MLEAVNKFKAQVNGIGHFMARQQLRRNSGRVGYLRVEFSDGPILTWFSGKLFLGLLFLEHLKLVEAVDENCCNLAETGLMTCFEFELTLDLLFLHLFFLAVDFISTHSVPLHLGRSSPATIAGSATTMLMLPVEELDARRPE